MASPAAKEKAPARTLTQRADLQARGAAGATASRVKRRAPLSPDSRSGTCRRRRRTRVGCEDRARYYHPGVARFISEDPLGAAGGDVNLYAYVRNNAVNRRDPLGLATAGFGGTLQGGILARLGFYLQGAVAVDTKGNVALTVTTPSSGSSLGFEGMTTCVASISGGGAFQFSPDAKDVHALGSAFETLSLGLQVAPGLQGTIEVDRSPTANVINVGASIGRSYPDIPISVTKVTTTTVVDVQFNIVDLIRRAGVGLSLGGRK